LLGNICSHTVKLATESGINLDMSGRDSHDGTALFPDVSLSITTEGNAPASPLPFDFTFQGPYRPDQTLPPANFLVTGHSDGPIVAKSNSQPSSGAYSQNVGCSNTGTATRDENNNQLVPKAITLQSNASGNFEPLSSVNPATYSLSFTMQRGEVVSGRIPASSLVGLVFIQYSLHGEVEPEMQFELNDGTGSDPTAATVSNSVAFPIQKGGFFEASWNIGVRCEQEFNKDNFDIMASKRSGTLTVNYTVTQ